MSSASSSARVPSLGAGVAGMKLDAASLAAAKEANKQSEQADNQIALLIELPDGKTELRKYRPDLTVGYVKVELAKVHGIPYDCQELELDGRNMVDPFSLSDYPVLKASRADNPVRIIVRRVVPSDGEGDEAEIAADDGKPDAADDEDYEDETFE